MKKIYEEPRVATTQLMTRVVILEGSGGLGYGNGIGSGIGGD